MQSKVLGGVLVLLGLVVAHQITSGTIVYYIHERSIPLVAITVPALLAMGLLVGRRWAGRSTDWVAVLLLAAALGLTLVVPARPLSGTALALERPAVSSTVPRLSEAALRWPAGAIELDLKQLGDLTRQDPYLRGLDGQRAKLLGFVYRPTDLPTDQFLVGRFLVRCCTADAIPLTVLVRYADAATLATDTWVEVTGTIGRDSDGPRALPVVKADQVTVVPQPSRPYLYP